MTGKKKLTLEVPCEEELKGAEKQDENSQKILPRTHSTRNISRAKIKTVKLTIAVITAYILCSAPFTFVQILAVFGSPSKEVCKLKILNSDTVNSLALYRCSPSGL